VSSVTDLSGKSRNRGNHELERLVRSVNYDVKGGQSHRVTDKGRGGKCLYETHDHIMKGERLE
jgi:hypothetical protein